MGWRDLGLGRRERRVERERETEEIWDSKVRVWEGRRTTSFWRRKE